jgi:hypothetical protein
VASIGDRVRSSERFKRAGRKPMSLRLVDSGWDTEIESALRLDNATVLVISPFIKRHTAERLLHNGVPRDIEVITRFDLAAFVVGVSDTSALRLLIDAGARIRGVRRLHAKVYIFGSSHAIITSANLTEAGLHSNHEFGLVANDHDVVVASVRYFRGLWRRAGTDLTLDQIDHWDRLVTDVSARGARPSEVDCLPDEGADADLAAGGPPIPGALVDANQAFVKFFGEGHRRLPQTLPILQEVDRAGCHWACAYRQRPRQVNDGALMFLGRLVKRPHDVRIFGRAVGMRHIPSRDEASAEDIARRDWKRRWRYYVRVHGAEFIDGTLRDGVSLYQLIDELGAGAFVTTNRRAEAGETEINPRRSYGRRPAVELTPQGAAWIAGHLQDAFHRHGTIQRAALEQLDWPTLA